MKMPSVFSYENGFAVFMLFACVTEKLMYIFIVSAGENQRLMRGSCKIALADR